MRALMLFVFWAVMLESCSRREPRASENVARPVAAVDAGTDSTALADCAAVKIEVYLLDDLRDFADNVNVSIFRQGADAAAFRGLTDRDGFVSSPCLPKGEYKIRLSRLFGRDDFAKARSTYAADFLNGRGDKNFGLPTQRETDILWHNDGREHQVATSFFNSLPSPGELKADPQAN